MAKKFLTSALPYVNNQPHLGNIVGSVLGGDVFHRYSLKKGDESVYICGTDEYGTATEMEAIKQNVHPSEIVARNRILHKKVYDWINIEFSFFGKTHCPEHSVLVQQIFKECYSNGYFEEKQIEQFYCNSCEQFLADRYVQGECNLCGFIDARGDQCDKCGKCLKQADLKNPQCSICKATPALRKTKHLELSLNALQSTLKEKFSSSTDKWTPNAKNIYEDWIKKELHSRSMTRLLKHKWGVQVPLEGYEEKVFYVWFDAPIGYFTFLSQYNPNWREWVKDAEFIQFMGKDNVVFHSVIFPATLLATGQDYPIVNVINSTEYLNFNGEKFSKSRKIGIFGLDLVEKDLGIACYWRFYLIKKRPETKDSDFNIEEFITLVNSDLISNFGNFCNRILKYLEKRCEGKVRVRSATVIESMGNLSIDAKKNSDDLTYDNVDTKFILDINTAYQEYKTLMDKINLREAISKAFEMCSMGNKYLQDLQGNKDKMEHGFSLCYSLIVLLAHVFEPFIPESSKKIFKLCQNEGGQFPETFEIIREAQISKEISVVFKPFTEEQLSNLRSYSLPK
jgi:methionyl-tRNA synthetase